MTLDEAQDRFRNRPSNKTAAAYLAAVLEYEADDMIGDDTFLDALSEIRDYLEK